MEFNPIILQVGGGSLSGTLFMIASFILIFYFFLIRPQQKRVKKHAAMIEAVKRGDMIVTQGGIVAKVVRVKDAEFEIEIADGVRVLIVKGTIAEVRGTGEDKK